MRCESCQHDNDDAKRFCTQCGAALGGRRCAQGHTIPEGLTDCPFCPRPVRAATVAEGAPAPRRQATALVSPTELERSGVQVGRAAPPPPSTPATASAAGGRSRTVFRAADEPAEAVPAAGPAPAPTPAPRPASASTSPLVGFLVSFSVDPNGQHWPLRYGRTSIGADPASDVHLTVGGVSGRHAEVMVRDNRGTPKIWLTDQNSTNGTQLNGDDIFTDRPDLSHGDRVTVAGVDLTVILLPAGQG